MPMISADYALCNGLLTMHGSAVLAEVPEHVSLVADPAGVGVFLRVTAAQADARLTLPLGRPAQLARFMCLHRYDPWWVTPVAGTTAGQLPAETQCFLGELSDGRCMIMLPLIAEPFRVSLQGNEREQLELVAESGDPSLVTAEITGVFVAVGADPYALMAAAAKSVMRQMGTGRLREEKPLPDFVDYFGWCTWDAFYNEVNAAKVRSGLESFAAGGVLPKLLILDDGWLSIREMLTEEKRLTSFHADPEKFPGGLLPTIAMCRQDFDLRYFLVWHALHGYWGGIDKTAFPAYRILDEQRAYSPGIVQQNAELNSAFGRCVGVVAPEDIHRFYQDFYRELRRQGVDGVKVDNQAAIEGAARGLGGRVALMRRYHEAMEGAAQTHFLGRIINCMAHANEVIYSALNSTVTRTFTDFWPNKPASHGLHVFANAQNTFWLGEFVHPDWDMFQSGHEVGMYHAAARAVSGGPVYVSDKVDGHNFDVLRKLVCTDGSVLRARGVGRPTRDCLFVDTTLVDTLLKVFNVNLDAGIIGVFNTRYHEAPEERTTLQGTVSPGDVYGLHGDDFAIFLHNAQRVIRCARDGQVAVSLPELQFELCTIVPIDGGIAPIGLTDKFNSAGAVTAKGFDAHGDYLFSLHDGGTCLIWSERQPAAMLVDGVEQAFSYAAELCTATLVLGAGAHQVRIVMGE